MADVECCLLLELRVCETPIFFKFLGHYVKKMNCVTCMYLP